MNTKEEDCFIPLKSTSVKCFKCYVDYWKSLKERSSTGSCFKHDYSIEKVKSFRKYFCEDKTLFYFCIDCFKSIMVSILISFVDFEMRFGQRGGCVAGILRGEETLENICNSCINFVIERFSKDDLNIFIFFNLFFKLFKYCFLDEKG